MAISLRISIPPLTRVLLVLLVGFSLIYQAESYRQRPRAPSGSSITAAIVLVPQLSIFYPWVYLTCTLAEQNIVTLAIAGATLFYGGRYLERAWGSAEFGIFILVATLIPNVLASCIYILGYALTRADSQAFPSIQGSISIQAAFLVAFKELVPEHTVTILKGVAKVRVKHFPAVFLAANTVSGIFFYTYTAAILCWLGFLTSWIYLRFYKRQPDLSGTGTGLSANRGDASETFAFAYFWPDAVHGPISTVADAVYNALVALHICVPFSAEEVESSNEQAMARGEGGLPSLLAPGGGHRSGAKREEAERRRALALKALDQRLQAASASRQSPIPPSLSGPSDTHQPVPRDDVGERERGDPLEA